MNRNRIRRVFAWMLAGTLLVQQGSVGTFAADVEAVSELSTEALETEAKAPEKKDLETETEAPETQAPETEAPTETATESELATEALTEAGTEAAAGTETEAPTETVTEKVTEPASEQEPETAAEPETEKAAETETEKAAEPETEAQIVLDTAVKQEVFQKTAGDAVQPMVKYTVKVSNKTGNADAKDVSVKVLLAGPLSYVSQDGETAELAAFASLAEAADAEAFAKDELSDETKAAYENGSVVLWKDQTIAAGAEKKFVFYAAVKDGVTDTAALRSRWIVNGTQVAEDKIQWEDETLLKVEKELPTEFVYKEAGMTVTATLSDANILPEGAVFVVKEDTMEAADAELVESALGEDKTIAGYVVYDMHFEVDGVEVEPEGGTVNVTVSYDDGMKLTPVDENTDLAAEDVEYQVLHITDDATVEEVTDSVDASADGQIGEVGFTTDSFSKIAVVAAMRMIAGDFSEIKILVNGIQVGSKSYSGVDIDTATGMFNGKLKVSGEDDTKEVTVSEPNSESNRYPVFLGESLNLSVEVPGQGYTLTAGNGLGGGSFTSNGAENLTATFTGTEVGPSEVTLKSPSGETKTFYVKVRYPIYVVTNTGTYHKDTIHHYLWVYNYDEDPSQFICDPNGTPIYVKNIDIITGNYLNGNYLMYVGETVELVINNNSVDYSSGLEHTLEENGHIKVRAVSKGAQFVKVGDETFYIWVREETDSNNSNHLDIEIADGGTYTITTTETTYDSNGQPSGKRETVTEYYAFVSGVHYSEAFDKAGKRIGRIESGEYYEHGDPADAQYELTSAYKTDNHGNLTDGYTPVERDIKYTDIDHVEFSLEFLLRPKKQTVTRYKGDTQEGSPDITYYDITDKTRDITASGMITMDKDDVLAAFNKCPNHSGLDFTIVGELDSVIDLGIADVYPEIQKTVVGEELKNKEFTYDLFDEDPDTAVNVIPMETVTHTGGGTVRFSRIVYSSDDLGTHTYYIKEEIPNETNGVRYDSRTIIVTVTVAKTGTKLSTDVKYSYREAGSTEEKFFVGLPQFVNAQEPHKTETDPGAGALVGIGQEITYEITWANYNDEKATVTIVDPLDEGVDFVEADNGGTYDQTKRTVTWTLENCEAKSTGKVTLTVKVNEKAHKLWKYGTGDTPITGEEKDHQVVNRASVRVNNDAVVYTEIIPNPVPEKEETTPGANTTVAVGSEITYRIHWKNGYEENAKVTVTDKLDPGVDFVERAENGGTYDKATHTVTWAFDAEGGEEGYVTLTVKVNEKAREKWHYEGADKDGADADRVFNQAEVEVGGDPAVKTEIIPNDVDEGPHKTEKTPGDGVMVGVGEKITYEITWKNYKNEKATVVVTDVLDPGVKFVDAYSNEQLSIKGAYDAEKHTVTWTLPEREANSDGKVTLVVEVTEDAYYTWKYGEIDENNPTLDKSAKDHEVWNRAKVRVGNDPDVYTEIVENPVPEKEETTPGADTTVAVGSEITYQIHWKNGYEEKAKVTVTDELDPGVDFVERAENGGTYDKTTHTVTWAFDAEGGEDGYVTLTVKVNEKAREKWHYDGEDKDGADADRVFNQAEVKVGRDPAVKTEIIPNDVDEGPHKTEKTPGDGVMVGVGEKITYEITWKNYKNEKATVVVTDVLDPGVKFVDAYSNEQPSIKGAYDAKSHTVTWTLPDRAADSDGKVTLVVEVTEDAFYAWKYGKTDKENPTLDKSAKDHEVWNRAKVRVDNDPDVYTEIVENPLPEKEETDPGAGKTVPVGKEITYRIHWTNGFDEAADVVITDVLDKGLDFVRADNSGTYDAATRTVTWTLEERDAKTSGFVTLVAKTNEDALEKSLVENQANVQVGDHPAVKTEKIPNPVDEKPHKTEKTPGDGVMVGVGEEITYEITWKNYKDEKATVIITDVLDPGVKFVDAYSNEQPSIKGAYDAKSHTVTWTLPDRAADSDGKVTLVVEVTEDAFYAWKYGETDEKNPTLDKSAKDHEVWNRAKVKVGNDPDVYTEIVENPVPEKEEITPGANTTVAVGSEITYQIYWKNGHKENADVTVTDKLDPGVDFVSAGNGGTYDSASHTVTWTLKAQAAGVKGSVTLTVRVNESAKEAWDYANGKGADTDNKIWNQAGVQVGNDTEVKTEIIPNDVDEGPDKTEVTPGDGVMVGVGEEITYEITWKNYKDTAAKVVVTDQLDDGSDFVSASNGGTHDAAAHTVTWDLGEQATGASGKVTVTVKVNERALRTWQYGAADEPVADANTKDHEVVNRAAVKVGDDPKVYTDIVENPLPEKEETTPGAGTTVAVGSEITYEIHWMNGHDAEADVTVTDELDPGVDFVSADNGGTYNAASHTVTWTLKAQAAGAKGSVTLTVRVNESAKEAWDYANGKGADPDNKIWNQAGVQVGNDDEVKTNIIPNPVDEGPEKRETNPGDGVMVEIGGQITYEITWKNYKDAEAEVVITDKLDPGVEFVGASDGGTAEGDVVTWNLGKKAANTEGFVTLTVKVTEKAFDGWKYVEKPGQAEDAFEGVTGKDYEVWNRAAVKVGNDPKVYTNIVENPVPEKKETIPGAGKTVAVGQEITYQIGWKNGHEEPATVTITDKLDPGVDFVSADNGGAYNTATHTVTWTLENRSAGDKGIVTLKVKVNEEALVPGIVENQAGVKVGNDDEVKTEIIPNNVDEKPHKVETDPGDGMPVKVGEQITYEVTWKNNKEVPADVMITDALDPGVDYVSSDNRGSYDEAAHTVIWNLGEKQPGERGKVTLTVKVNAKAFDTYTYQAGEDRLDPGTGKDYEVLNRASVQVGNDAKVFTETMENPVEEEPGEPTKEEVTPGDKLPVKVGEQITYKVNYYNYKTEAVTVTVTDALDKDVKFISAGQGGVYDAAAHMITWKLTNVAAHTGGSVEFVVEVLEGALNDDYKVLNQAGVQVGNDPKVDTNIVENPVEEEPGEPTKEELTPGDKLPVKVGEQITYRVNYRNYKDEAATVTVTDALDKDVKFISAGQGGVYDAAAHMITWKLTNVAAHTGGSVEFVVEVLPGALSDDYKVLNQAGVQVGNDPKVDTNIVENPVEEGPGEPTKEELTPGDKLPVKVGERITYKVNYYNYKTEAVTVTVTDALDKDVKFISAGQGGVYDAAAHMITWKLTNVAAHTGGSVEFVVEVLEGALSDDYKVLNQAGVQVGNDPKVDTNIVENPVEEEPKQPEKTEPTPGDGMDVKVGDAVDYEITYRNYRSEEATVTITDPLDEGVDFVSAGEGGVYDAAAHTVTWVLEHVPAHTEGTVSLRVRVNRKAKSGDFLIQNQAGVQIGNEPKVDTNIVENPVPDTLETVSVEVVKYLKHIDDELFALDETFYVALFADAECTVRLTDVMPLTFRNASSSTVTFRNLEEGRTYYVAETDADGNAIGDGVVADGTSFTAIFPEGADTVVVEQSGGMTRTTFDNVFVEIPDNFYKESYLTITKKVLDAAGEPMESDETFYAGIFDDADHTKLSERVSQNIVPLHMAGMSEISETIRVNEEGGQTVTLYVAEVTADGVPVGGDFGYTVTIDRDSVSFDADKTEDSVTITNQLEETVESEVESEEETEGQTEQKTAPRTGDDTPIAVYGMTMLLAALALAVVLLRRRETNR